MPSFCKHEDCPPSQELLAFQRGDIPLGNSVGIRKHLAACEFCAAEVDFYEHYPVPENGGESEDHPDIPSPLLELAEALIGKKQPSKSIGRLIDEIDDASKTRS